MYPVYRIAERTNGHFEVVRSTSTADVGSAKVLLEKYSAGKPLRDFCIIKAVWDVTGREIIGWVFCD